MSKHNVFKNNCGENYTEIKAVKYSFKKMNSTTEMHIYRRLKEILKFG